MIVLRNKLYSNNEGTVPRKPSKVTQGAMIATGTGIGALGGNLIVNDIRKNGELTKMGREGAAWLTKKSPGVGKFVSNAGSKFAKFAKTSGGKAGIIGGLGALYGVGYALKARKENKQYQQAQNQNPQQQQFSITAEEVLKKSLTKAELEKVRRALVRESKDVLKNWVKTVK